ncbi:lipocalin-like [Syngnathoides biaculeatus]|uniref:lipocalin-like n=1 Tax=Syngnathoides biaculeatus TaxID=300417 RepID=UPI002ADD5C6A|nr:lipocalin-like [Syngnathoides biaculeatus]
MAITRLLTGTLLGEKVSPSLYKDRHSFTGRHSRLCALHSPSSPDPHPATMVLLVTVLVAALAAFGASAEVIPQADFNVHGMAGKWYLVGFASNGQWFVQHRASMKMGTAMLNPTADGDLDISYASLKSDGTCWRLNNLAKKTDMPGKFTYTSWGNENDMRMVDVKYDQYALTHTLRTDGDHPTIVNKLYGRGVDLSPDLLEKFRQFSLETGIPAENIVFLPKNGECPAA